ncbi:MAG: FAD:protein FMN transferase [Opitutaceae bacterium]|nr:FAD:protein FMN transferase [Opitutaceae bacterium]
MGILVGACLPGVGAAEVALTGRAMGTVWTVKFVSTGLASAPDAPAVARTVSERLEHLEQLFSTYRPDSALSRFNRHRGTDWVPVAPEMAVVAQAARQVSALTAGAFDVTVLPLLELWGFGPHGGLGTVPSAAVVAQVRTRVDWRQLETRAEPPALRKGRADLAADFSSLAKGWAADEVSRVLRDLGLSRHLVQVGGDVKAGGDDWPVAIERPLEKGSELEVVVRLDGDALSTSGDYRNFHRVGARRYGHILDPRTGEPAHHALAAVSVIDPSCARSSALATALFVLGPDDGWRLARREGLAALFLVRAGDGFERRVTPEFERRVRRR